MPRAPTEIIVQRVGSTTIVELPGGADLVKRADLDRVCAAIDQLIDQSPKPRIVISFANIRHISSMFLGKLMAFNKNLLARLNRELGGDFDLDAFAHRARWNSGEGRIEMHLVARRALEILIPGVGVFAFARGETIRTEVSCKYDRGQIAALLTEAGLQARSWLEEPAVFSLTLAGPA